MRYRPFTKEEKEKEDLENDLLAKDLDNLLDVEMRKAKPEPAEDNADDLLLELDKLN